MAGRIFDYFVFSFLVVFQVRILEKDCTVKFTVEILMFNLVAIEHFNSDRILGNPLRNARGTQVKPEESSLSR